MVLYLKREYGANGANHVFLRAPNGRITAIDAPAAGTGAGQGTFAIGINAEGSIAGWYVDEDNMMHGFLRIPTGWLMPFDVRGAGTSAGQGTIAGDVNDFGVIAGYYMDTNSVAHGFVRGPNGEITTLDAPGAGTGTGQGTSPSTSLASPMPARLQDSTLTGATHITASCAILAAGLRRLMDRAQAQARAKAPSQRASTMRRRPRDTTVTRTAWLTVSCVLHTVR